MRRPIGRRLLSVTALLVAGLLLSSCSSWRGISNVPLPGGPGSGPGSYTVYAQVPDTLALNGNSRVLVHDVYVGTVEKIELRNWVATLKMRISGDVKLPRNARAKIGQTSLLGSQHVELETPPAEAGESSDGWLSNGDVIPLSHSSAYPTIERTMAGLSLLLRGGGVANLDSITTEIDRVLFGRADEIRAFLTKLDTFTAQLNDQRDDITHAIDSTDRLLTYVAARADTIDRVLTEVPPLIRHFNAKQSLLIDAVDAVGRLSAATDQYLGGSASDLHRNLAALQCPLRNIANGSEYIPEALKIVLTQPYSIEGAMKAIRGDFINDSLTIDLSYAAIDNAIMTGTGFSGALRALEQSFGHDPAKMVPDVRYTPNPLNAPGGPYVERADRNC